MSVWTVAMLMSGALYTGGIVWYAWDRSVFWRQMSLEEFSRDFRRSIGRADPAQPVLGLVFLISAIRFGATSTGLPRLLAWTAAAGLAVNIIASLALLVPAQYRFVRQPEGQLPADAEALRSRWLRGHLYRTAVVVASFTLSVLAVSSRGVGAER